MTQDDDPMDEPRRLTRSTESSYIAGVAGGLGRYFGLDPVLFRVAFGVSIVFGGIGLLAYVGLWLFLPRDDGEPSFMDSRSRATTVAVMVVLGAIALTSLGPPSFVLGPGLLVCAGLVGGAVLLYRSLGGAGGEDPARMVAKATLVLLVLVAALGAATGVGFIAAIGGGTAEAVLAIFAGLSLIAAGLLGGPRWLLLPVIVLVLPLGVVTAAGIDLHGGVGHREYRPASVADLRPEYRIGAGEINLDLGSMRLPPGRTDVKVVVGVGDARVRLPDGACASTHARIGAGATELPDRSEHGFDVTVADAARDARSIVHVDAQVGLGFLRVTNPAGCA
jgi:phage shock protein PspC (stress-responsive transcriptional regulator)